MKAMPTLTAVVSMMREHLRAVRHRLACYKPLTQWAAELGYTTGGLRTLIKGAYPVFYLEYTRAATEDPSLKEPVPMPVLTDKVVRVLGELRNDLVYPEEGDALLSLGAWADMVDMPLREFMGVLRYHTPDLLRLHRNAVAARRYRILQRLKVDDSKESVTQVAEDFQVRRLYVAKLAKRLREKPSEGRKKGG